MEKVIKIVIASDIHYRCADYFGRDQERIAELFCEDLAKEYEKAPYDALLLLGDYSLDHWKWQTKGTYLEKGISNAKLFRERFLERIAPDGVQVKMIAGNHEQYGEALWQELTGFQRRDHLVIGDFLFILTDTYGGDLDPTEHSDGTYIGADVAQIRSLMASYPDKKTVLCAHWFDVSSESDQFRTLLKEENRILCLFCGHNHKSRVASTGEEFGNKPILYTGHYSYSGEGNNVRCLPGYRVLELGEDGMVSKYVVWPHRYKIGEVYFSNEYTEQDSLKLRF